MILSKRSLTTKKMILYDHINRTFIFLTFLLVVLRMGVSQAAILENVRVAHHAGEKFTRLVLDLRGGEDFKVYDKGDKSLGVFLADSKMSGRIKRVRHFLRGNIRLVKVTSNKKDLSVQIDCKTDKVWSRVYELTGLEQATNGYRLVIDVYSHERDLKTTSFPPDARPVGVAESRVGADLKEKKKLKKGERKDSPAQKRKLALPAQKRPPRSFAPLSEDLRRAFNLPVQAFSSGMIKGNESVFGSGNKVQENRQEFRREIFAEKKRDMVGEEEVSVAGSSFKQADKKLQDVAVATKEQIARAKDAIHEAKNKIAQGRYVEALDELREIEEGILPAQLRKELLITLSDASHRSEDYQYVVSVTEKLFSKWPGVHLEHPELLKERGEALYYLKRYREAPKYLLWYYDLVTSTPGNDLVLGKAAECMLYSGDAELALRLFRYLVGRYKTTEGALIAKIRIAEILEKNGFKESEGEAPETPERLYKSIIELRPRSPLANIARAKLASWYYRQKRYSEGATLLSALSRRDIDSTMLLELRSTMEKLLNDWVAELYDEKKYDDIVRVYELYNNFFDPEVQTRYLFFLAESYWHKNIYLSAISFYKKALTRDEATAEHSRLGLGACYLKLAHPEEALKILSKVHSKDLVPEAQFYSGKAQIQLRNYQLAARYFEAVLEGGSDNAQLIWKTNWWLGFSYYQINRLNDAKACFEKVVSVKQKGNFAKNEAMLALAYFYKGNCEIAAEAHKAALSDFKEALKLDVTKKLRPGIAESLAILCMAVRNQGVSGEGSLIKEVRKIETGIDGDVARCVENEEKIESLQEMLKEGKA